MTAYIVMGVIVVGMGGLLLLVLHWDKQDHGDRTRGLSKTRDGR